MKKLFALAIVAGLVFTACNTNDDDHAHEGDDAHTHEDGTMHSHDEDDHMQEEFMMEDTADTHMHEDGTVHEH